MKRVIASAGILLVLIVLSVWSLVMLESQCRHFAAQTHSVTLLLQAGETESALQKADALAGEWDSFHHIAGVFVDGERLAPIRVQLSELPPLLADDTPEALSLLASLEREFTALWEEELPSFWHVL